MAIVDITDADFDEKVLKSKTPVIVDFWAVWCGPCKLAEPILEELSDKHKDKIIFAKLDVDANPQYTRKYNVLSIPTTILFKNGEEIGRQVGFSGENAYEDLIKKGI